IVGYTENFTYDNLNRLTTVSNSAGILQKSYSYDPIGNITNKSDVGSYTYDPNHPHAVQTAGGNTYIYDANGNQTSGAGRTLAWTSFNKPSGIWTANGYTGFGYDANHNRITKTTPTSSTVYIGKIFEEITIGGLVKDRNHIYAGSKLVASIENNVGGLTNTRYMHGDHLGSISVITDEMGAVVERLRFDVFGAPVNLNGTAKATIGSSNTTRGYTGHEMDASTGLINMNARLYDPVLGKFLSADTIVPSAGNMQDFNRYAYVNNNPLAYTDPSGHFKWSNVWKAAKPIVAIAATAVVMSITGNPMLAGAVSGFINTGNIQGAVMGAISGAFFAGAGAIADQFGTLAGIAANGVAGGTMSMVQGGKFGTGFISGGLAKGLGSLGGGKFGLNGSGAGSMFSRVAVAGVIGGVGARVSGGNFWSGFQTGAFSRLFNTEAHGDGYFARKLNYFKSWANSFGSRYGDFVGENIISLNASESVGLIVGGAWSKRWVPFTGGRPAALGSKNPLTSVPRAFHFPAGKAIGRVVMPVLAPVAVGIGFYNSTILLEGLIYAY
ncbi:MAG: RHS repeat-associated core domain-containing protein, partial [Mariprofundaceae bacterium]|nr:RHS repeat-associated core domain-containing protein [Mariprofundaceae bacterium]